RPAADRRGLQRVGGGRHDAVGRRALHAPRHARSRGPDRVSDRLPRSLHAGPGQRAHRAGAGGTAAIGTVDAAVSAAGATAPAAQLPTILRLKPGTRFLIESGTYDIPLVTGARALRRALEARHVPVAYFESPQGHNHTAFRSRLPAVMTALFPPGDRF